jgi:ATP-dependent exoDNAse (exonuclease V) alpha subunit
VEDIELAVGDRLRWTRNDARLGRRNGQEFEVYGSEEGRVLIRYGNGKTESLGGSELAHLDYALVSTTYGAQGKSAERVIGALDRHLGRESFYVTVSRVKHDLKLYASENLDVLLERARKSRTKENPSDAGLRPLRPKDTQLQHLERDRALDVLAGPISFVRTRSYSKIAEANQDDLER